MLRNLLIAVLVAITLTPAIAQPARKRAAARAEARNDDAASTRGKILLVITNHGRLGDTDHPTGYWMSEVSHAWTRFTDAHYDVVFASPKGATVPVDPRSFKLDDPENKRMWNRETISELGDTKALEDINPKDFKAIYFAGGHGTMWDFPDNAALQKVTTAIYEQGGVVSAVCHGPAALVNVKLNDGKHLVDGKKLATFTDAEETSGGLQKDVPFMLESKLRERGAKVETAPNYKEKVVTDGRLVTGQNPASAAGVADAVLKVLEQK